jgi:hypothetical protein
MAAERLSMRKTKEILRLHFAAGLGGFDWIDLDTPLLMAEDPVSGGYIAKGPCYQLDVGSYGHGGVLMND